MTAVQTMLAVTGFFVAIVALYAALNEADAVRKQQQASVLPVIQLFNSFDRSEDTMFFTWQMINDGIGPGRIKAMRVTVDGEPVVRLSEMLTKTVGPGDYGDVPISSISGRMIRPGQSVIFFDLTGYREDVLRTFLANWQRVNIEYCYCSVFDQCWTPSERFNEGPQPVKQCPDYGDEQFLQ